MALYPSARERGGNQATSEVLRRAAPGYLKGAVKPFVRADAGGHNMPGEEGGGRGFLRPRIKVRQPSTFAADLEEGFGRNVMRVVRPKGTPSFVKRYLRNVFEQRIQQLEHDAELAAGNRAARARVRAHIDGLIDKYEGFIADEMRQGADQAFEMGFRGFLMGNYQPDDAETLATVGQHSQAAREIMMRRPRWLHTPGVYNWIEASVANRQVFDDFIRMMHEFGPIHPLWRQGYSVDLWALYLYYKYVVAGSGYDDGYDNEDLAYHALWADVLPATDRRDPRPEFAGRYTVDSHVFPGPGRNPDDAGRGPASYQPEAVAGGGHASNLPAYKPGVPEEPPEHDTTPTGTRPRPAPKPEPGPDPAAPTVTHGTDPRPPEDDEADERRLRRNPRRTVRDKPPSGKARGPG